MKLLMQNIGMTLFTIRKVQDLGVDTSGLLVNMDWQHLIMNDENLAEYADLLAREHNSATSTNGDRIVIFESHPVPEVDFTGWQDAWSRTLATNLIGPANLSYLAARIMMVSGGGRVVNVSSRGAFRGEPETPAYGASKAGLNAMSQSLAQALAPHGVYFYVVAPGFVETDMADALLRGPEGEGIRSQSHLGRVATPEEVARTVAFLASEPPIS